MPSRSPATECLLMSAREQGRITLEGPMRQITITVTELPEGGYVIGQGEGEERAPVRAVSSLDEMAGVVHRLAQEAFPEKDGAAAEPIEIKMPRVATPTTIDNVVRPGLWQRL